MVVADLQEADCCLLVAMTLSRYTGQREDD